MTDLLIRGEPEDLEELRRAFESQLGRTARLQPVTSAEAGQLREPVLITLIVGLGGPTATAAIAGVIKRYLEHKEKIQELSNARRTNDQRHQLRMSIVLDDEEHPVVLNDLTGLAE